MFTNTSQAFNVPQQLVLTIGNGLCMNCRNGAVQQFFCLHSVAGAPFCSAPAPGCCCCAKCCCVCICCCGSY